MQLYKTTIVIWSEYPTTDVELLDLAHEATGGDAYCSVMDGKWVAVPEKDSDWDGTEFFLMQEDDSNVLEDLQEGVEEALKREYERASGNIVKDNLVWDSRGQLVGAWNVEMTREYIGSEVNDE